MKALAVGGVTDHVHMLLSLPATMSVAKAMQLLKENSSKWIHETFPKLRSFAWQEGYAGFSVGVSGIEETRAYIRHQEEHHRTRTYREEVIMFLKRHGLAFDDDGDPSAKALGYYQSGGTSSDEDVSRGGHHVFETSWIGV